MKKIIILFSLVTVMVISACHPYSSEVPRQLVGFWGYDNGKQLGLYEEFAIFRNDFWKYQDVKETSDGWAITLAKDSQTECITVGYQNDTTITLTEFGKTYSCMLNHNKRYKIRNYAPVDTTGFLPVKDKVDSATIIYYSRYSGNGAQEYFKMVGNLYYKHVFDYRWHNGQPYLSLKPVDTTEHYGVRYKFNVPVQGVTEIDPCNFDIEGFGNFRYSEYSEATDFILQPGDTLVIVTDDFSRLTYGGTVSSFLDNIIMMSHEMRDSGNVYIDLCPNLSDIIFYEEDSLTDSEKYEQIMEASKADMLKVDSLLDKMGDKASKKFVDFCHLRIKGGTLEKLRENNMADSLPTDKWDEYYNPNIGMENGNEDGPMWIE